MTMFVSFLSREQKDLIAIVCRVASSLNIAHIERVTAEKSLIDLKVLSVGLEFQDFRLRLSLNYDSIFGLNLFINNV